MTFSLPHDPYAAAVIAALAAAGIQVGGSWTQETEEGEELELLLSIAPQGAVCVRTWPLGVRVLWTQVDGWTYAGIRPNGWSDRWQELMSAILPPPSAAAAAIGLLLSGQAADLPVRWSAEDDAAAGIHLPADEQQLLDRVTRAIAAWDATPADGGGW
jgi:hypothetical protein